MQHLAQDHLCTDSFPFENRLLVTAMCKHMECAMACAEQFPFTVSFNSGITPLERLLSFPFAKEETGAQRRNVALPGLQS